MEGRVETTTATGATTIKGHHNHLMASKTPGAIATKGAATRAATLGRHLQLLGNPSGGEVLLVDVAMAGMILEAVMKVIPVMAGATLGTTGVHPRLLPDPEVHHHRQLPRRMLATRGEVTARQLRVAAVVATATRRATTSRAHRMEVAALHLPEVVAALMAEVPMAAQVAVVTGDEHAIFAAQDGLLR